tara:strand:- start:3703 stop:4062 length:360 start_codon:yes stop_codon:yes gene_type:complete
MANTKITDLTELAAKPATDDILAIVDVTGTDTTKKITVARLMESDVTGNATTATTAATVTTAAQPAITSLGTLTSLKLATSTPASASATGTVGTISWDTGYVYVCTATNTWERVAIATW